MRKEESRTPSVEEIVSFLNTNLENDLKLLNNRLGKPIITDTDKDMAGYINARLNAYMEVKSFITRGKKG